MSLTEVLRLWLPILVSAVLALVVSSLVRRATRGHEGEYPKLPREDEFFRPGMVAVIQTFGDEINLHPHVHALVTRGGWTGSGQRVPVPYVRSSAAEGLLRHKVIRLLQRAGLLGEEEAEALASGPDVHPPPPPAPASPSLAALRRGWAQLIRRVYEVDPLVCPRCRGVMRVVSFITEGRVIRRILDHLGASARRALQNRAPPLAAGPVRDSR